MKVLAVAQVEDQANVIAQIEKQRVKPDHTFIFVDQDPAPNDGLPSSIDARRRKIAQNHKVLREAVEKYEPAFVWQLEGDGILPSNALERLLSDYNNLKEKHKFGYVSGVQVGRHGIYALGAWQFNTNRTEFSSLDHKARGIQEVDATGMYCLFATYHSWLRGTCDWNDERWGPDVNFGLSLRDQGYRIYVDTTLQIGHVTQERGIIYPNHMSVCNVRFYQENRQWKYRTTQ